SKRQATVWSNISNAMLGIDKSDFISKVAEKLPGYAEELKDQLMKMPDLIKYSDFTGQTKGMKEALQNAVKNNNISAFITKFGEEGIKAFDSIVKEGG